MFWKKTREIKRLKNLVHLKEAERRAEHIASGEVRKELATVLKNYNDLKERHRKLSKMLCESTEREDKLEADIENRKRLYAHYKKVIGAKIHFLMKTNQMLGHNNEALSCSIAQEQLENLKRHENEIALSNRLAIYEKIIGNLGDTAEQENNNDDRIQEEEIPHNAESGKNEAEPV